MNELASVYCAVRLFFHVLRDRNFVYGVFAGRSGEGRFLNLCKSIDCRSGEKSLVSGRLLKTFKSGSGLSFNMAVGFSGHGRLPRG